MTTIDDIVFFYNRQCNRQTMITLVDCVHVSKAVFTIDWSYWLEIWGGLGITKADNKPTTTRHF